MSRALNVNATQTEVTAMCAKHKATISAIEALPAGGTRVVMMNMDDAAVIAKAFKTKVMTGVVRRTPLTTRWR